MMIFDEYIPSVDAFTSNRGRKIQVKFCLVRSGRNFPVFEHPAHNCLPTSFMLLFMLLYEYASSSGFKHIMTKAL